MTTLGFAADLTVWGASWSGDLTEFTALISEEGVLPFRRCWDLSRDDLRNMTVNGHPVPDWWALPWLPMWMREVVA